MLAEYHLEGLDKLYFEQFCTMFQGIIYIDPKSYSKITSIYSGQNRA